MADFLKADQLSEINSLGQQGKYAEMYATYAKFTGSRWAATASSINGGTGFFGVFAREYMKTILGPSFTNANFQSLSNEIAEHFLTTLNEEKGLIHSDEELANREVVEVLTKPNTVTGRPAYPAHSWPGTAAQLGVSLVFDSPNTLTDPRFSTYWASDDYDMTISAVLRASSEATEIATGFDYDAEGLDVRSDFFVLNQDGDVVGYVGPEAQITRPEVTALRMGLVYSNIEVGPNGNSLLISVIRGRVYGIDPDTDEVYFLDEERKWKELNEEVEIRDHCFAAGTPVEMADGTTKAIENVELDDMVMAFDGDADGGRGAKVPRRVTQLHRTENQLLINFHGTKVTPGHAYLTGEGTFLPVIEILQNDGAVVMSDGRVIRARTGWEVGSREDQVVPIGYPDGGEVKLTAMRAGTLYGGKDGKAYTIEQMMNSRGYHLMPDGRFVGIEGDIKTAYWEWGVPDDKMIAGKYADYADLVEGSAVGIGVPLVPSRPN